MRDGHNPSLSVTAKLLIEDCSLSRAIESVGGMFLKKLSKIGSKGVSPLRHSLKKTPAVRLVKIAHSTRSGAELSLQTLDGLT